MPDQTAGDPALADLRHKLMQTVWDATYGGSTADDTLRIACAIIDNPELMDALVAYRQRTIQTTEEMAAVPPGTIVRAADGTVACRHPSGFGVLFGHGTPFDWSLLSPPAVVLLHGDLTLPDGGR
ncbi:hypothetical protein [Nocardia wallacei]|uniref:hypothetical protein n=1 Tax=Nocardia wallacei TaxID=480035 RepID=UPI002454640B|nr:hypothetical protein [Nocardia wallacei]